jgi:hypothetical protein
MLPSTYETCSRRRICTGSGSTCCRDGEMVAISMTSLCDSYNENDLSSWVLFQLARSLTTWGHDQAARMCATGAISVSE